MISDDELRTLMALAELATPGPWSYYNRGFVLSDGVNMEGSVYADAGDTEIDSVELVDPVATDDSIRGSCRERDAAYIAASDPTTVSDMAAELLAARERIRAMEAAPIVYIEWVTRGGDGDGNNRWERVGITGGCVPDECVGQRVALVVVDELPAGPKG